MSQDLAEQRPSLPWGVQERQPPCEGAGEQGVGWLWVEDVDLSGKGSRGQLLQVRQT